LKKRFVPRKEKIYLLFREEKEKVQKFIQEQMRKKYIWPSKLLQIVSVFFSRKERWKKVDGTRLLIKIFTKLDPK